MNIIMTGINWSVSAGYHYVDVLEGVYNRSLMKGVIWNGITHVGSETTDGGAPTPTSESGERRGSTPDSIQALPLIEFPGLGDFTRRFERQSWRERHEEERRRLKQRFEVATFYQLSWRNKCTATYSLPRNVSETNRK